MSNALDKDADEIFDSEFLHPIQLQGHKHYSPEERLVYAVMAQALEDVRLMSMVGNRDDEPRASSVSYGWFMCQSHDAWSFLWVCDVLSLDPDAVRAAVRKVAAGLSKRHKVTLRRII